MTEYQVPYLFVYSGFVKDWLGPASGLLLTGILALDLLTPQNLVLAILYNIPIALSILALSRRLTLSMTFFALLANVAAGYYNAEHAPLFDATALGNRILAALSFFLVAILSLQAVRASVKVSEARNREEKAQLEGILRHLIEVLSASTSAQVLLEQSCKQIRLALEAKGVAVVQSAPSLKTLFCLPEDWAVDPPIDGPLGWPHTGVVRDLNRFWVVLKPGLWLLVQEPKFPHARTVLLELSPTLQALLGKVELFERTQSQQREIARHSEVIRDLVYAFSHDLRTPLMANALNMRLALEGAYGVLPEAYKQSLQHGLESNQALLDMAESLLLLARLESPDPAPNPAPLDLAQVAKEALAHLQTLFDQKQIVLRYEGVEQLKLQGHELELKRLLQNLLDNAGKFAPIGSTVQVRLKAAVDKAVLQVIDQGRGIGRDQQKKLFARFSGSHEGNGSGLGLYLCKQIVLAHRGQIRYRENPTGGSIFEVELPL